MTRRLRGEGICADVDQLEPGFAYRLGRLMQWMCERGSEALIHETRRTAARQKALWEIGRRGVPGERKVTWVRRSRHQEGVAADVVPRSRDWSDEAFFKLLSRGARLFGLRTLPNDRAHVELDD